MTIWTVCDRPKAWRVLACFLLVGGSILLAQERAGGQAPPQFTIQQLRPPGAPQGAALFVEIFGTFPGYLSVARILDPQGRTDPRWVTHPAGAPGVTPAIHVQDLFYSRPHSCPNWS